MRKRFNQQLELGIRPISEVKLRLKSRHSLVNILRGLQYVFSTPDLNEQIFTILENKILKGKQKTGRLGMSLWELLVFGVVRLNLDIDYDELHDLSNEHESLRGILGVGRSDFREGKEYELQTLKDNVPLLDEATIYELNEVIIAGSHGLLKKKEGVACLNLHLKADSFVVESNIHFPTDLNLLWDSMRKSIETIGYYQKQQLLLKGCREWKQWRNKIRNSYRWASEIHRKKGKHYVERLQKATAGYLHQSRSILEKIKTASAELLEKQSLGLKLSGIQKKKKEELAYYISMSEKHIDLVDRRILQGEQIPSEEKVFSIFESHVEWNSKGKSGKPVELGHNTLVVSDQYNLILYGKVYEKQVDKQVTIELGDDLKQRYGSKEHLSSISFDKNFYSQPAEKNLEKKFDLVVLPKAGRKSKREKEKEVKADYQDLKKGHAKIEGNINELEHHGLDVCPDKGIDGFKRYVAYAIVSYNLSKLGKMLNEADRLKQSKARKKAKRKAQRAKLQAAA